jgi:hypothetical protein
MKEQPMDLHESLSASDATAEAQRQAYNAAFEELGLNWHWDRVTFAGLRARGPDAVRSYLHEQQPHLLRAYDCEFLVQAIESAKSRYDATMARSGRNAAPHHRSAPSAGTGAARSC